MRHANSYADCKPISNGHSYVYAYPDSPSLSYTYSDGNAFGDAYLHTGSRTDNNTLRLE